MTKKTKCGYYIHGHHRYVDGFCLNVVEDRDDGPSPICRIFVKNLDTPLGEIRVLDWSVTPTSVLLREIADLMDNLGVWPYDPEPQPKKRT